MTEQDGDAGQAGEATAARASRPKRRKSSRARKGATSQPKLQGKRSRRAKPAGGVRAAEITATLPLPLAAVTPEVVDIMVVATEPAMTEVVPYHEPIVEAVCELPSADIVDLAPETDATAIVAVPEIDDSALARSVEPGCDEPLRAELKPGWTRSSFVRWATAASILAACVLALGRFSETHVSARAVSEPIEPSQSRSEIGAVRRTAPPPIQIAALALPPISAPLVAPPEADAALIAQPLASTIAPSAKERVLARDAAAKRRVAKIRQPRPERKEPDFKRNEPDMTTTASQPAEDAHTRPVGHAHALGRYELSWGTARLHEDPNSDNAQGPVWDFVASAGAR